ncbi:dTDP-4-dehydrorhamnose reductase [Drancourtella sp. An210]|nr:dTDP-4-dehydrorhamnose reductase [Drancourtella sp. An210]OUP65840.1 dTDP-4-dehydrorhamnose reductase [Drancourtella sp. An177]
MRMKIWIAGAKGQLGCALNDMAEKSGLDAEILNTDREEVDVTDIAAVLAFAREEKPDVIFDCAAVTDVGVCEAQAELAYKVNAVGARNLAIAAHETNAKIVLLSTDDVFNGIRQVPYHEFDETDPMTIYGRSKLAGENYVKEFAYRHFIIRSNWVFGRGSDRNFVNQILKAIETKKELYIAVDQYGSPTSANALASFMLRMIQTEGYGTYHVTCDGVCNRCEFAKEIVELAGKDVKIIPVPTMKAEFSSARPTYTVLDNFLTRALGQDDMPTWIDALEEYIEEIRSFSS